MNLGEKTFLFYDAQGSYVHMAQAVVGQVKQVKYFCPWQKAFSVPMDMMPGIGLEGIDRVVDFWDELDGVDLVVFTDVGNGGMQEYIRGQGIPVFGSGSAGEIEMNRAKLKSVCQQSGIDVADYMPVRGIDNLREMLSTDDECYVKVSYWRGLCETFHHTSPFATKAWLDDISLRAGPYGQMIDFILEKPIAGDPCVEIGFDTFTADGMYPDLMAFGYEAKDSAFALSTGALPSRLMDIGKKLQPMLKTYGYRGPISIETRVTEQGDYFVDITCFSADTEILTDKGWKFFQDLDQTESVATLDVTTRKIVYQRPTAYQAFKHDGPLMRFSSLNGTAADLLVTPDHGFWTSRRDSNAPLKYARAKDLKDKLYIPRTGIWHGIEPECFTLSSYEKTWSSECGPNRGSHVERIKSEPSLDVLIEPWLAFLGVYLSEGSSKPNGQVSISQFKHVDKFRQMLSGLPWDVREYGKGFQINSVQLSQYVGQFGKCHEKFVPDFVKTLSPRLIKIFLDAYCLGDGHERENGQRQYFTTSKRLADDLQELIFKSGDVANINIRKAAGTVAHFAGGVDYIRNHDLYIVSDRPHFYYLEASGCRREDYISEVAYSGMVYDVTVPNGTIYVRRKGKPLWTSNCRFPEPPSSLQRFMVANFAEIMWESANGRIVEPEYVAKIGVELVLKSAWGAEHPLAVQVGRPDRVTLHGHCVIEGQDFASSPAELEEFGAACGMGSTLEEAMADAIDAAEGVKGFQVSYEASALEELTETIAKGIKLDLPWQG